MKLAGHEEDGFTILIAKWGTGVTFPNKISSKSSLFEPETFRNYSNSSPFSQPESFFSPF